MVKRYVVEFVVAESGKTSTKPWYLRNGETEDDMMKRFFVTYPSWHVVKYTAVESPTDSSRLREALRVGRYSTVEQEIIVGTIRFVDLFGRGIITDSEFWDKMRQLSM